MAAMSNEQGSIAAMAAPTARTRDRHSRRASLR